MAKPFAGSTCFGFQHWPERGFQVKSLVAEVQGDTVVATATRTDDSVVTKTVELDGEGNAPELYWLAETPGPSAYRTKAQAEASEDAHRAEGLI